MNVCTVSLFFYILIYPASNACKCVSINSVQLPLLHGRFGLQWKTFDNCCSKFLQAECSSCCPTNSIKALKESKNDIFSCYSIKTSLCEKSANWCNQIKFQISADQTVRTLSANQLLNSMIWYPRNLRCAEKKSSFRVLDALSKYSYTLLCLCGQTSFVGK